MVCVLVVDDEPAIRELLIDLLTEEGFETIEAATADDAVPLLQDERIRLLLTDINLPGRLDGIGLAKAARERSPGLPVMFISGRPEKLVDARVVSEPAAFVQKPFALGSLIADVQRIAALKSPLRETGGEIAQAARRIAVVDDQDYICDLVTEIQAHFGYHVCCASTGTNGATLLASSTFSLALIDVLLPDRSGLSLAAVAANANTPTLMMSGHPDAAEKCELFGFPYLTKPFGIAALRRETARVLEDHDAALRQTKEAVANMEAAKRRLTDEVNTTKRLVAESVEIAASAASMHPLLYTSAQPNPGQRLIRDKALDRH